MPQKIVANGCSYTQEYYLKEEDRWTTKIGATNLALGGGSNERIFHTTIEYLNQNDLDVLIVGWTGTDRFMLPKSNGSRIVITPGHSFDEHLGGDESSMADFYYKHCHNEYTSVERTLNYMIHIQEVCKVREIKLLYFTSFLGPIRDEDLMQVSSTAFMSRADKDAERMGINYNYNKLKNLIGRIDDEIWIIEPWCSMKTQCKDFPVEEGGHPAEAGSAHWAGLVKKYL